MKVTVNASIECEVGTTDDAHALSHELETRLLNDIKNLIPNLRHAQQINAGQVSVSSGVSGLRMRIQNNIADPDRVQVEGVEGEK